MIVNQTIHKVEGLRIRLCKWNDAESLFIVVKTPEGEVETLLFAHNDRMNKEILDLFNMDTIEICDYSEHRLNGLEKWNDD
jgi:hypothetical protein